MREAFCLQNLKIEAERQKVTLNALKERLPHRREILYVFGGVVFLIYSWAIRGFLYQLSSLRLYHTVGDIFGVFSYLMAFALLESLVIMGLLILIGLILPGKWFREGFAYKGFITTIVAGMAMVILHYYLFLLNYALPSMNRIYLGAAISIILLVAFILLFQSMPKLQTYLLLIQERLQIFIYFYIPLGFLGLAVVLLRNLF